jgi:flagellar assembly protein FliH
MPADQYKQQVQINASTADITDAFEEAKSKGFEEGYKQGEEKAELQTRERATKVFSKVGELVSEFGSLKGTILENVQQNFYELSQAIAETLLKRELKMKPKAFAEVVRRAIDEAVEPDSFKIHVNPEMFDEVKALNIESISSSLVKDPDVELGDFRIESDLSVVDGNIRKIIGDLLNQADLDLFDDSDEEDEEKAS